MPDTNPITTEEVVAGYFSREASMFFKKGSAFKIEEVRDRVSDTFRITHVESGACFVCTVQSEQEYNWSCPDPERRYDNDNQENDK